MIHDFEMQFWILKKAADPSLEVPFDRNRSARVAGLLVRRGLLVRGGGKNSSYTLTQTGKEALKRFRSADAQLAKARQAIQKVIVHAAA